MFAYSRKLCLGWLCCCLCWQVASAQDWWRATTVYQIYPRSFSDTNGDGIGDLQGIIDKLDYLKSLGIETIWISPYTQSPQKDFGYDVSNYRTIAPEYGNMALFEKLLHEVHARNMKLVFDLVLNHTSDEHEWFMESSSSQDNAKADWYIWKNGRGKKGTKRPNNWRAMAGNRAWTYHPERKQFYYTGFLPFQPDLNYSNPAVKDTMFNMVRFWLKKGVDGFRLDIISAIYEDSLLRNNPPSGRMIPSDKSLTILFQHLKHNFLQERSFEFASELRKVVDEYPNKFIVGETHGSEHVINKFCLKNNEKGLHTVFLFKSLTTPFRARKYRKMVMRYEESFPEPLLPTYVFGNHDRTRLLTRLKGSIGKAKLLALFQFTARGIPFIYYGEEIGMEKVRIPLKQAQDPVGISMKKIPQFMVDMSLETLNRDECRTPMQWNASANAGFCSEGVKPWLPIAANYATTNVEAAQRDSASLLHFYKQVLALRNTTSALQTGKLEIAKEWCSNSIFAFYRIRNGEKLLVLMNMTKRKIKIAAIAGKVLLSTHAQPNSSFLQQWEGRVIQISE